MPKALVCINTDFFTADGVLDELKTFGEVEEVFRVYGVYDVVAKIRAESTESLLDTVTRYLKILKNVKTAHTMLIIEPESSNNKKELLIV